MTRGRKRTPKLQPNPNEGQECDNLLELRTKPIRTGKRVNFFEAKRFPKQHFDLHCPVYLLPFLHKLGRGVCEILKSIRSRVSQKYSKLLICSNHFILLVTFFHTRLKTIFCFAHIFTKHRVSQWKTSIGTSVQLAWKNLASIHFETQTWDQTDS